MSHRAHLYRQDKILQAIVIALALVALFLGWKIFSLRNNSAVPASEAPKKALSSRSVLATPNASSSPSERAAYADLVRANAQAKDSVEIASCVANPVAVSVKAGKVLTFRNKDAKAHTISFGKPDQFLIEGGKSVEVPGDFRKQGIYAYGCDGSRDAIGVMLVW